jgi:hypothetical protein
MNDYGGFFVTLVVACLFVGALIFGLAWLIWPEEKPEQPKQPIGRVEMCKWIQYDPHGVAIDSGYFPVTIIDDARRK